MSHELNHDPEVLELVKRFGAPGLQLWLEILSTTDKTENVLKVSDYWLEKVSKLVGCRFATGLLALNHAVAKGWLEPNKPFEKGLEVTYNLPNYAEYHRTRSANSHKLDSQPKQIGVPPSFLPNLPKEKEEEKSIPVSVQKPKRAAPSFEEIWAELKQQPCYQHINFEHELGKMNVWRKQPKNKKRQFTYSFLVNWLNKIEPPVHLPEAGKPKPRLVL